MNQEFATVIFKMQNKKVVDIEVPLNITANDLVVSLNEAYNLNIDTTDIKNCFFKAEQPIALLRGNKSLRDFGVRNGTIVIFTEHV